MKDMNVKDLKNILKELPDDMLIVIPVVDELDVNNIISFRKARTAGVLRCETEEHSEVLCLNGSSDAMDISDQINSRGGNVTLTKVLYGKI